MSTAVSTIEAPPSLQTYVFSTAQAFENAQRMAIALSKSTLVPKEYLNNTANCLIALEIAQRTQSSPLLVMQNLYIVHGKPSWSSQFIIAAINGCGRFRSLRFDKTGADNTDDRTCVAWTVERHVEVPADIKTLAQARARNLPVLESPPVSIKMAKEEGWFGKNGSKWKTMPELMLCYRTATFFGRLYAPEILMGMRPQDEVEDMIDVTPQSEGSVLKNLNEAIKAEQGKVHEVDSETGEVLPASSDGKSLSLAEWLEEIANIPSLEGVDHKFQQAAEHFTSDREALAHLTLAKTQRKQFLSKPKEEKAAEEPAQEAKPKGMFRKKEGEAA